MQRADPNALQISYPERCRRLGHVTRSWPRMTMQSLLFRLTRARGEEMTASLWSFVYFFALLAGYYVLRPIRDEMAVQVGQARLQELFTAVFLTMLVVAPVFGALTARFPRKRLLPWAQAPEAACCSADRSGIATDRRLPPPRTRPGRIGTHRRAHSNAASVGSL